MKRILTIMALITALVPTMVLAAPARPADRDHGGGGGGDSTRPLVIKRQPRSSSFESADPSKRIELKIEVQGGVKPYAYTWYQGALGDISTQVSTRSEARISITPGTYTFWANVTDRNGNSVDSNEATIEFIAPGELPLAIRSQTGDLDVIATDGSKNVQLKVEAEGGTQPYDTIWYEGDSGDTTNMIDSGNEIRMDLIPGIYAYWAQVTDANGDAVDSSTINVTVNEEPLAFVTEPANATVLWRGATSTVTTLRSQVKGGVAPYSYNWLLEGSSVGSDANLVVSFSAVTDPARIYSVEVTDGNGNVITSRSATVRVVAPAIKIVSSTTSVTARWSGSDALFSLSASASGGAGALTYTWYAGTPATPGAVVGTGRVASIRIVNASAGSYSYHVVVTDSVGTRAISRVATVRVPASTWPTATRTVAAPTATAVPPTATTEPTATATAEPTATAVPPTATATAEPTATEVPPTATATAEPTATEVPPTATAEPTIMPTPFRITR